VRLPGWLAPLITRKGEMLPLDRAASRISAFAYGNILVLSVVIAVGPSAIDNGNAALLVLGTTISTYLAHIFAGWLSHVVRHVSAADGGSDADAIRVEVRDAVPILSSGTLPAIFLALGAFDILGPAVAQLCAGGVIVLRLGVIGLVIERLGSHKASWRTVAAGIAVAVLAAAVTIVKVVLTH